MMIQYLRGFATLSCAAFLATHLAAAPVIGVASTRGTMEVDSQIVRGVTNISDGSSVRTNETTGQVQLENGTQATLGLKTAAVVFTNRLELHQGAGEVAARKGFDLNALGVRIAAADSKTVVRVAYERPDRILVTVLASQVNISRDGVALARLGAGATYFFEAESPKPPTAESAGRTVGGHRAATKTDKSGPSTRVKWGIAAAAATSAGVGLGVGLFGNDASR